MKSMTQGLLLANLKLDRSLLRQTDTLSSYILYKDSRWKIRRHPAADKQDKKNPNKICSVSSPKFPNLMNSIFSRLQKHFHYTPEPVDRIITFGFYMSDNI